jgi:hypothetical protein
MTETPQGQRPQDVYELPHDDAPVADCEADSDPQERGEET